MITGMDRLVAAINGEKSDRIPVFCNLFDQGAKELGMSIEEYYSKGEYVAEAQLKMREKYGYDNVWNLFYVGKEAQMLGCNKMLYAKDGPPNVGDFIIKNYDDVAKLEVPKDLSSCGAFAETLKCTEILRREVGGKYPICAYITAGMTIPALLMGMDKWFELMFMGPKDVRDELLAKCSELCRKEIEAYKAVGVDVFVYSNPFGSTDFVSLKQYDELSMPWMQKDLAGFDTAGLVYYCGSARFNKVIDRVFDKLGLSTHYLSPLDDIDESVEIIAERGLACGVINDIKLLDWSKDEIRAEVKRIISAGMKSKKFLFGTLLMPYNIPEENIRTLCEAAYEYGVQ